MKKTVFCIGVFDLFHVGHVRFFERARALGDNLIVGVVSDEAVRKQKGEGRPIINFNNRAEIVASLRYVDYVYECSAFDATQAIRELIELHNENIKIFAKGEDQAHIFDTGLINLAVNTEILHRTPDVSTSELVRRLNG